MNNLIKTQLVREILNRKVPQLVSLDFIFSDLARRVISRLDFIKIKPEVILECGIGLGIDRELLANKYPEANIVGLDIALNLVKRLHTKTGFWQRIVTKKTPNNLLCADAQILPIATASVDFVYANLLLPYLDDIPAFIRELRRVLTIGGSFCIAGLGVDSFKEVRELGLNTNVFPDMHDIGDMLVGAGFTNPVVDTEYITLKYDDLATMLTDIRTLGCGAAFVPEPKFINRQFFLELSNKLNKPIELTVEMFVAHGWKDQNKLDLPPGQSVINFKSKNSGK